MNEKTCSQCSRVFPDSFPTCPYCGQQVCAKKKKYSPTKAIVIVLVIVLVLGAAGFGIWKAVDYTTRKGHLDRGDLLMTEGRFMEAIEAFAAAGDFEDAADRKLEAEKGMHYVNGRAAYESGNAELAIEELTLAGDFPGVEGMLKNANNLKTYQTAERLMASGDYSGAMVELNKVPNWTGAKENIKVCNYHLGQQAMDQGDYGKAVSLFTAAGDYSDAKTLTARCNLTLGKELLTEGDMAKALTCFKNAKGKVEDIEPQMENYILLCQTEVAFAAGRLTEGLEYFDQIPQNFKPAEFDLAARRSMKSRIQGFAKLEGIWTSTKYDVKISSVEGSWIYTKYYPEGTLKDQTMTIKCTINDNGTFNVSISAKYYYFNYYPYLDFGYTDKSKTITFTLENLSYAPSTHKYDSETTITFYGTPKLMYQANINGDTATSNVTYDQHSAN